MKIKTYLDIIYNIFERSFGNIVNQKMFRKVSITKYWKTLFEGEKK